MLLDWTANHLNSDRLQRRGQQGRRSTSEVLPIGARVNAVGCAAGTCDDLVISSVSEPSLAEDYDDKTPEDCKSEVAYGSCLCA